MRRTTCQPDAASMFLTCASKMLTQKLKAADVKSMCVFITSDRPQICVINVTLSPHVDEIIRQFLSHFPKFELLTLARGLKKK